VTVRAQPQSLRIDRLEGGLPKGWGWAEAHGSQPVGLGAGPIRVWRWAVSPPWTSVLVGLLGALALVGGCTAGGPGGPAGLSAQDARLFGPLALPADFDRQRAEQPLSQIPDDPPAPAKPDAARAPELPRQALRCLEDARRLFDEQSWAEAIRELEKALRYNASNAQAHRLLALACLLSGRDSQARLFAQRALEIDPASLACHYVLARLADKVPQTDEALSRYRIALKCPVGQDDAPYRELTHYHLGILLEQERYYRAAAEQLEAFEAGVSALSPAHHKHPELANILQGQRGMVALRMARAYALLGNAGASADALGKAVSHAPGDADLRRDYIAMLVRARRLDQAAREAERFVRDSGADRAAVELLLAVHRVSGHPERGVAAMKQMVAQKPDDVGLGLLYAEALVSARRYTEAVQTLNELLARHPEAAAR